jgi:glycosyltransferase involved in cell wall biosynthesis
MNSSRPQGAPRPLVSVILPTRDRLELLRGAVASVRAQSEQRFELIVVDDLSTDGTQAYLARLAAEDGRIRVVRNAVAAGGGGARNEGIKLSRGQWVAFIDDDDEWMPNKLEQQLRTLRSNTTAVACSCSFVVRSGSGASRVFVARANTTVQELLVYNWLGGASGCLCASEALSDIGGFDAKLKAAQDLDLWVRLRQRGDVVVCAEALVLHQAHAGPRITTNVRSQYMGARRFYLKHRDLMSAATRRHRMSYSCYVMSTEVTRRLRRRLRFLTMALLNSSPRYSLGYIKRSVPMLVRDALLGLAPRHKVRALGRQSRPDEK